MICRLFNTRAKVYISPYESMDYLIHPLGGVLWGGTDARHVEVELCSQKTDKFKVPIFENDIVEATVRNTGESVRGVVKFFPKDGLFAIADSEGKILRSSSYTHRKPYTWNSYGNINVVGNARDDEMEAE